MKVTRKTITVTLIAFSLSVGTAFADMMGQPMSNQAPMTDTNTDQINQDHEQMKQDHDMMMKGHKGASKMGKQKPMPSQNSGGGMNHQMGTGAPASQGSSNSMGGGMTDM